MGLERSKAISRITSKLWIVFAVFGGVLGGGVGIMAIVAPDALSSVMGMGFPSSGADGSSGGMGGMFEETFGIAPQVTGTFQASTPPLGSWSLTPNQCQSGEHHGFFGVLLYDEGDQSRTLRVAREPSGQTLVAVTLPGTDQAMVLRDCQVLRADLHRSNTSLNEIWGMEGTVEVSCPEVGFAGSATFGNCF